MFKRLKKGFTLAELLIVVAIIAVLTAIAVPLFVTGINDAKESTKQANIRVVRVAAVYEILSAQDKYMESDKTYDLEKTQSGVDNFAWIVSAKVTRSGDIQDFKIWAPDTKQITKVDGATNYGDENEIASSSETAVCNEVGGEYYVTIYLTETELSTAS